MLAYTLQKMLERQMAVIERDMAAEDQFGGEPGSDWQTLGEPVPCQFYWRKEGGRGPAKEVASAGRSAFMSEGGMILQAATDITVNDRVARILDVADLEGDPIVAGPLFIQAVFDYADHVEVSWISP